MAQTDADGLINTGGIELSLTNSSDVLTKLVGLQKLNDPHTAFEKVKNTDQDSGGIHTYLPGMGDTPDLVATLKHVPGSATHDLILEHLASKELRPFKMSLPVVTGAKQEGTANLFVMSYEPDDGSLGAERTAVLTCSIRPLSRADAA